MHHDVKAEARAEDVLAERSSGIGIVDRSLDPLETEGELAAQEDEGLADLEGVGGDDHTFDELVRFLLNEKVVLEGGRLRLVTVDDEIGHIGLAQHRPLAPRREAGAATTKQ